MRIILSSECNTDRQQPPKDYEDIWPEPTAKRDRTDTIAFLCLLSAIGGFLIGWTI